MIIEIVYTSPKEFKIGAEAIKWYLNTDYSHVAVRWYSDRLKRYMVYHAAHGSVHFVNDDLFRSNNIILHTDHIEITDDQYVKLMQRCIDLAGFPYGYSELLNILRADIQHAIIGGWPTDGDTKGYICSELLADLLSELGFTFNKPKHLINPRDIYEKIEEELNV